MIVGTVNSRLDATITVTISGIAASRTVDAVIDTGFDDYLTLPKDIIDDLQLDELDHENVMMADGRIIAVNMYAATVDWQSQPRFIIIQEAPEKPLLGMKMLQDNRLTIDVRYNGSVSIDPLP